MRPARRPSDALLGWTIDVDSRRRTHTNRLTLVIFPGEGGRAPGAVTPSTSADSRWGALVLTTSAWVSAMLRPGQACLGIRQPLLAATLPFRPHRRRPRSRARVLRRLAGPR